MANEFRDKSEGGTGLELVGDEGVSEVIDFGFFDVG